MISANIQGQQGPATSRTGFPYSFINRAATSCIKGDGRMSKLRFVMFAPIAVGFYLRRSVNIVIAVNGPAFVAVKPCAVTTKCKENGKRGVRVVPHWVIVTEKRVMTKNAGG